MTFGAAFAVYFVVWWTVLFAVLPFGIRSQLETGEVVKGSEPGAPVMPGLRRKAVITSLISCVVFLFVWYGWAALGL